MSSTIPVIKFMFRADLKVLNEALNIKPAYEVEEVSSANDLSTFLSTISAGLVIASLKDKNDLIQIATFLKISKKIAKDTVVKLVVLNFSADKQYEKAIAKLGIQDLIEPAINTKALKFKLDFWMKSLNVQIRNSTTTNANAQKNAKAGEVNKAVEKKVSENAGPAWLEPLELENDIWILKLENDCKKVLSKWLIRLLGPSPYVGQWVEVKPSHWRYDFKETEKELFVSGTGSWFFSGDQKPEFVWKENVWLITGENFDLYYKDEHQVVSRLKSKDKNLTICKNSLFARTKESLIIESFDKDLLFKREAENLENLEGKNKTDQINGDPLSGKNTGSENIDGNLSGKTEGEAAINHENLSQKTTTEKKSTFWNGKNSNSSIEDDFSGPQVDGPNSGPSLERERKDLEHQKYYKNHNEAQKYAAVEAQEREKVTKEDRPAGKGHLSGKSSTDELEKNYDNSKSEKEKKATTEKERELSGKSETDKLKSHYGQKDKTESTKAKEAGDLDGKSSTDKLNSHYGKAKDKESIKNDEEKEKEAKTKEFAPREKIEKEKIEAKERERKEKEERETKERTHKAAVEKIEAKELERKEKEEKINKERSETSQRNKAEAAGKDKKFREEQTAEKEKNEKTNLLDKEQKTTRRNEASADEDNSGKSKIEKNWEGEHAYGMKGESSTEKLAAHYKNKKEAQEAKAKEEASDPYAELFGKTKTKADPTANERAPLKPVVEHANADRNDNVLPLNKVREEKKAQTAEEKELDEITRDAKVTSFLTQNNKIIRCHLDDFFDETIIFSTDQEGISPSGKVSLDIVFQFLDKDSKLRMQGDVLSVEGDGDGNSYVTVKVNKENANSFDTFMRLYEIRQTNVNEFMKKVKGI